MPPATCMTKVLQPGLLASSVAVLTGPAAWCADTQGPPAVARNRKEDFAALTQVVAAIMPVRLFLPQRLLRTSTLLLLVWPSC